MASSSSSSFSGPTASKKYDVFISFRGEDTRNSFTSHLYDALLRKKIETFIDNTLNRGEEISTAIKKAIEESKLSVIIFSENFASSSWCLDELVLILDCRQNGGQVVVPVFHNTDPSHVRRQLGSYADAFTMLEERFNDRMDKVNKWRDALTTASNLSGWNSLDIWPESKLVKTIVEDILKKLNRVPSSNDFRGLVGMDKRIEQVETLLDVGLPNIRVVGIWGMGGIGKTTLAGVIFKRLASQFDGCCFLSDIRNEVQKQGMAHLQNKLISELLEEGISSRAQFGSYFTNSRLRRAKVLIVLDDVKDSVQLELLVGHLDCFGPGSRIIITTRDIQVLRSINTDGIYKVEELNDEEALQLFNFSVFKEKYSPTASYTKLSRDAVNYAGGVPLALKVLGSFLCGKSEENWEISLERLQSVTENRIQNILRTSYDELCDNEQRIFLDIACFFNGEDSDFVVRILKCCKTEIDALIDKSLVTVTYDNKLWMHDLIQKMGLEIVRKESIEEPGRRSRLWNARDIYHVLKNSTATGAVQGIVLDMSKIREINFNPVVFQKMCNLRILKIYNSPLGESIVWPSEDLQSLSDKLTYLQWDGYHSKFLPINFIPENLVELVMPNSQVEQLWSGVQPLGSLKKIDLSGCCNLTKMPDLSDALNLTNLTLEGCLSLGKFPELPRNVKNLNLNKTSIREVPSSIQRVSCLEIFDLSDCRNLESLPTAICKLKSLQSLYLSGCSKFRNFPEIVEPMERLAELELDRTAIKKLHPSIGNLVGLVSLHLEMCQNLEFVPDSIYNISSLEYVSLWRCVRLKCPSPDDLPNYLDASRTVVPRVESSRTVLMRRWDSFSNVGSSTRRYNYLQRVPAETAGSSSNQQSYSGLMILNPEPKESRIAPLLREESILREESTLSKLFSTTLKWWTKG